MTLALALIGGSGGGAEGDTDATLVSGGAGAATGQGMPWALDGTVLGDLAVQHRGRMKPFAVFAQDVVRDVTGETVTPTDAMDQLTAWYAVPAASAPRVASGSRAAMDWLGIPPDGPRPTLWEVWWHPRFASVRAEAGRLAGAPQDALPRDIRVLVQRVEAFAAVGGGQALAVFPDVSGRHSQWATVADARNPGGLLAFGYTPDEEARLRQQVLTLTAAAQAGDAEGWRRAGRALVAQVTAQGRAVGSYPSRGALQREVWFARAAPFQRARVAYALAVAALAMAVGRRSARWARVGVAGAILGMAAHATGLGWRSWIAGRPPVTNLYETVVWVTWAVVVGAGVLAHRVRTLVGLLIGVGLALLGLWVAEYAPTLFDPTILPLVPVLRHNVWLALHVPTVTLGYAALTLATGLAHVRVGSAWRLTHAPAFVTQLDAPLYRVVQGGVVLLAAGITLGGIWAHSAWGRFWGWDPKETWALVALLGYLVVLHGRAAGWWGTFGFAVGTIVAFAGVLMSWYGVNVVWGTGLHSYGFSPGGMGAALGVLAAEAAFLVLVALRRAWGRGRA